MTGAEVLGMNLKMEEETTSQQKLEKEKKQILPQGPQKAAAPRTP